MPPICESGAFRRDNQTLAGIKNHVGRIPTVPPIGKVPRYGCKIPAYQSRGHRNPSIRSDASRQRGEIIPRFMEMLGYFQAGHQIGSGIKALSVRVKKGIPSQGREATLS